MQQERTKTNEAEREHMWLPGEIKPEQRNNMQLENQQGLTSETTSIRDPTIRQEWGKAVIKIKRDKQITWKSRVCVGGLVSEALMSHGELFDWEWWREGLEECKKEETDEYRRRRRRWRRKKEKN